MTVISMISKYFAISALVMVLILIFPSTSEAAGETGSETLDVWHTCAKALNLDIGYELEHVGGGKSDKGDDIGLFWKPIDGFDVNDKGKYQYILFCEGAGCPGTPLTGDTSIKK